MNNLAATTKGRLTSLADQLRSTRQPAQVVLMVSVDAITPNPRQPRKTFNPKRMEELAASVGKNGIKQPLRVTLVSVGRYELVSGERRWRAAKMAALKEVPALVDDKLDDHEKLRLALVENLDRDDMTPVDEARGISELVTFSSVQEVAEALSRSKQWVSKRMRIAKAPEYVHAFAESAAIGDLEAIYELAKFSDDNPEEAQRLIAEYEPGSHLRAQLKAAQHPLTDHGTGGARGDAEGTQELAGGDDGGEADREGSSRSPRLLEGSEGREPDLSRSGAGPRGGGGDAGGDEDRGVSHAKLSEGGEVGPMRIEAVLRRKGEIVFVTSEGKHRVEFSEKAKEQLAQILAD
ncbi:MAG TPA: ParB/RepB/Spo0J family partition protein [Polyangia bacterium]|nr:ParB/RepB/Spo0J family partition protein [Polyangia bacterium]